MNKTKKSLGQFYTVNQEYILQNIKIPKNIQYIIEPFAGKGDLISFIKKEEERNHCKYIIECYDIEPKQDYIIQKDTIINPPDYKNKYLITNPPYLARNKSSNKTIFDQFNVNDLYKCIIKNILTNVCLGGILIIPLNFWCGIRLLDIELRKSFLQIYNVILLNIFEEQVFEDTTYTICSFQFELKNASTYDNISKLNIHIYPSNKVITTELNENNNYIIGGEIYNLKLKNIYKITRLTIKNKDKLNTNLLIKCVDNNINSQICLSLVDNKDIFIDYTPNQSCRTYATLIIEPTIDKNMQEELVIKFNKYIKEYRTKYHSLFLSNYRESKDIARKRISFDLVYSIIAYILENWNNI